MQTNAVLNTHDNEILEDKIDDQLHPLKQTHSIWSSTFSAFFLHLDDLLIKSSLLFDYKSITSCQNEANKNNHMSGYFVGWDRIPV
jgi:hypothetical protein